MKKIILLFFSIICLILPTFAEGEIELPSEVGVVEEIVYKDITELHGENNVKQIATVKILSGKFKGEKKVIENVLSGNPVFDINLKKGNKVILHVEQNSDEVLSIDDLNFYIADLKRDNTLILISAIFIGLLLLIGRKKGLFSLVSILATVFLIFSVLVPLILNGISPILSAIVIGILSTVITIYLVGGFNSKSTSAIIGTSASLVVAGGLSMLTIFLANLTGFSGEESTFLYSAHPELNFKGLLSASIIISALGALMDTGVSIASAINEIHETDCTLSSGELFKSGMNIGKDIIGTMSNTLILVYLGASLPLVLLSSNIDLQKFFNLNQVATEITSALIGSIAILFCVPLTAMISSILIKRSNQKIDFDFDEK